MKSYVLCLRHISADLSQVAWTPVPVRDSVHFVVVPVCHASSQEAARFKRCSYIGRKEGESEINASGCFTWPRAAKLSYGEGIAIVWVSCESICKIQWTILLFLRHTTKLCTLSQMQKCNWRQGTITSNTVQSPLNKSVTENLACMIV